MRFVRKNAFGAALTHFMKVHGVRYVAPTQPIVFPVDRDDEEEETYELDSFEPKDGAPAGTGASGTSASSVSYMGFAPTRPEDVDTLRHRRAKAGAGVTKQGGE